MEPQAEPLCRLTVPRQRRLPRGAHGGAQAELLCRLTVPPSAASPVELTAGPRLSPCAV